MISITEIVLIVAGFAAIILGYLLPAGKEMDEEDKMLMEREIRELVRREVEDQKDTIENMVDDTVDHSLDRTERAMERISNEKMSAIGEYSDTVMNDIHKNHDEVLFMYDMLNDKHKNLTSVVSEVTRKADEAKQAVLDAEATAREAQAATNMLKNTPPIVKEENVRAILLDETDDRLSGIRIPVKEKTEAEIRSAIEEYHGESVSSVNSVSSGYVDEKDIRDLHEMPVEYISDEQAGNLHVIGNRDSEIQPLSSKVVPITEAVRAEGRVQNPDKNMMELSANDPISQNRQIIEMHKAGKSNMVIARELGLGIGEVKLVIDLSNKHRKVK
jgi:hypothetical protein